MGNPVYRSVIDSWLMSVVVVSTVATVAACGGVLWYGLSTASILIALLLIAVAALQWWLLMTTDYTLTNHTLEIRSGPFHWSIPLRDIVSIEYTRNPMSSPALSLDRLRVEYGGHLIMISPENRERFLGELRTRRPDLIVRR